VAADESRGATQTIAQGEGRANHFLDIAAWGLEGPGRDLAKRMAAQESRGQSGKELDHWRVDGPGFHKAAKGVGILQRARF